MCIGKEKLTEGLMSSKPVFFDKDRSDLYFINTREVLKKEQIDPVVTMEIFPNGDGTLCGITEVLTNLSKVLPKNAPVWAIDEGETMFRKEVVLRIKAPYSSFGIYETAYLGTLAQKSGWATAARSCVMAAAGIPVISFGARHVHPAISDQMEYSSIVGGCFGCATPAGARLSNMNPKGTMPHTLMLIMGDTLNAAQAFDRHISETVNRIVLVDTFMDEVEESVRIANEMGERLQGVRLDTPSELGGVTPDLVVRVRNSLDNAGHSKVKIYVSGGMTPERIEEFTRPYSLVDGFGVGSAISGAPPIDFTADIKTIDSRPVAKRGRKPGITENNRLVRIF